MFHLNNVARNVGCFAISTALTKAVICRPSDVKDRDQLYQLLKPARAWYLVQPETHHLSLNSFIDKGDTDQARHPTKVS